MALLDILPHYLHALVFLAVFWLVSKSSLFGKKEDEIVVEKILVHPIKVSSLACF